MRRSHPLYGPCVPCLTGACGERQTRARSQLRSPLLGNDHHRVASCLQTHLPRPTGASPLSVKRGYDRPSLQIQMLPYTRERHAHHCASRHIVVPSHILVHMSAMRDAPSRVYSGSVFVERCAMRGAQCRVYSYCTSCTAVPKRENGRWCRPRPRHETAHVIGDGVRDGP